MSNVFFSVKICLLIHLTCLFTGNGHKINMIAIKDERIAGVLKTETKSEFTVSLNYLLP